MGEMDYYDEALATTRDQFVERNPFPFFVGADVLKRPTGPAQTIAHVSLEELQKPIRRDDPPKPLVLAIRKVQSIFPSMISVGRTHNNDVVVPDVQVSKVHAFVKVHEGQYEISDAGSRNGTFVGGEKLIAKGAPRVMLSGERVRFGTIEFVFFPSEVCWHRLRVWKR